MTQVLLWGPMGGTTSEVTCLPEEDCCREGSISLVDHHQGLQTVNVLFKFDTGSDPYCTISQRMLERADGTFVIDKSQMSSPPENLPGTIDGNKTKILGVVRARYLVKDKNCRNKVIFVHPAHSPYQDFLITPTDAPFDATISLSTMYERGFLRKKGHLCANNQGGHRVSSSKKISGQSSGFHSSILLCITEQNDTHMWFALAEEREKALARNEQKRKEFADQSQGQNSSGSHSAPGSAGGQQQNPTRTK